MKLGLIPKMLAGALLTLTFVGTTAFAGPMPQQDKSGQKDQQQSKYPNATREEPKLDLAKQSDADQVNEGTKAIAAGEANKARSILKPYADGKASKSRYAQVIALQGLANLDYQEQKLDSAISKLKKALGIGIMPNDTYFGLMYELAQFYAADEQNQKALDTLHKWREEGKRETADSYGLEGVLDYQLKKYKEAIAAIQKAKTLTDQPKQNWSRILAASYAETGQGDQAIAMAKKQLAADPGDATTRHNLISLLINADKYSEAMKIMEDARANNELTTSDGYINLAKLYLQAGQNSDKDPRASADKALAVIKEGQTKGILKPDFDYYKLEGDAAITGGYNKKALAAYTKAAKLGHDGSADLMRSQLLAQENKYTASRTAAEHALAKGTKHKGRAYVLIAEAQRSLKNRSAAVTAMKKAAQDPETRTKAEAWLKKTGN